MGKDIRRGHKRNVICAMCGQITRKDRAFYAYKEDAVTGLIIKVYYCPDCAKKVHGTKLYRGRMKESKENTREEKSKIRKKFISFVTEETAASPTMQAPEEQQAVSTQPADGSKTA
jgi:ribosomal protein S26